MQLFKSYSTKYKQEVEICKLFAADLLKCHLESLKVCILDDKTTPVGLFNAFLYIQNSK